MRPFLLKVALGLMSFLLLDNYSSISQVFNPNDVNVEYDPQNPPVQLPDGQPQKWVKLQGWAGTLQVLNVICTKELHSG